MNADQLPPHDTEAEAGALACVLTADNAPELQRQLALDFFYDERHRTIFRVLQVLRIEGKPLDPVCLAQKLRDLGQIDEAGGIEYLVALPDASPSPANFPTFLETLTDRATRRAVLRDAADLQALASNPAIAGTVLATAARKMGEAYGASAEDFPAIVDAADFTATSQQEPKELVRGIVHQGSKLVLGGGSKSFKTWTLLDLALSVAYGEPWLGFETVQGPVLYLNFEIQDYAWQRRIAKVAEAKQIEQKAGAVKLWNLRGRAADFQTLLPRVISQARTAGFALIVLDPIYKLYGRTDENKAGDVAALLNGLEALAVETGAAVAFGAHFSKGNQAGKESIDRISGSGVFARDPDSILVFTRHETEDAFTVEATLRNFPQPDPFVVRWQFPLMQPDSGLDPSRLKQVNGRKPDHNPEDLLALLEPRSLVNKDWIAAADDEGISRRTFFRLKKALEQENRVSQDPVTLKWRPVKTA